MQPPVCFLAGASSTRAAYPLTGTVRQPRLEIKATLPDGFRIQAGQLGDPLRAAIPNHRREQPGHPSSMFLIELPTDQLDVGFHGFRQDQLNRRQRDVLSMFFTDAEAYWLNKNRETIDGQFLGRVI
ncbi:hypothetical protein, partial [uncultured Thiocystis sp.]|uniref:hypothetical protein n=1 Tax=uncultured Thiocystis sp. TaxID=1202134 RepID=UPI0025E498B6